MSQQRSKAHQVPKELVAALNHVRTFAPEVDHVLFLANAKWCYMDEDGTAPAFPPTVDVGILEAAQDAVDNAYTLPVVFHFPLPAE